MVSSVDSRKTVFDKVLWILAFGLVAAGLAANYYYANISLLFRVFGFLAVVALSIALALQTQKGKRFWTLWLESIQEVRKMYWPSRKETVQTTIAVVGMAFVMGILLWTTDFILLRVVAWLTGHWGA